MPNIAQALFQGKTKTHAQPRDHARKIKVRRKMAKHSRKMRALHDSTMAATAKK